MREDGEITKETYLQRKKKNDDTIQRLVEQKNQLESEVITESAKQQVMAKVIIDNSKAVLIGKFVIGYEEAKNYANRRRRKVKRVHWDKPAVIRIYADL